MQHIKLMYITNRPQIAKIAENAGVDRVFVDMEYIGKHERQGGMDTVQSHHTLADVEMVKSVLSRAELLVRCNPIHEATETYIGSKAEIDGIVARGADIIMLPYFKTAEEVRRFVKLVDGRVKTMLLLETPAAVDCIDEILEIKGIDEMFIGLNDLSLGYGKKFMFELLANGTVEMVSKKIQKKAIPYGFGGIASLGKGMLPSEYVIKEHYRLGSTCAILSRSFCNSQIITDVEEIRSIFDGGLREIRKLEMECKEMIGSNMNYFADNAAEVGRIVKQIVGE